jgi:hypothetical protein
VAELFNRTEPGAQKAVGPAAVIVGLAGKAVTEIAFVVVAEQPEALVIV